MATRQQVEAKLRELIHRLAATDEARGALARSLPDPKTIAVHITDLDADYWTVMRAGRMDRLHAGQSEDADIRIRVASDQLVSMVDGKASMFSAYLSGQIKIEASVSDLLRLRRLT